MFSTYQGAGEAVLGFADSVGPQPPARGSCPSSASHPSMPSMGGGMVSSLSFQKQGSFSITPSPLPDRFPFTHISLVKTESQVHLPTNHLQGKRGALGGTDIDFALSAEGIPSPESGDPNRSTDVAARGEGQGLSKPSQAPGPRGRRTDAWAGLTANRVLS